MLLIIGILGYVVIEQHLNIKENVKFIENVKIISGLEEQLRKESNDAYFNKFKLDSANDTIFDLKAKLFVSKCNTVTKGYETLTYYVTNDFPCIVKLRHYNTNTGQDIIHFFPESIRNPLNYATNFFNTNYEGFTCENLYSDDNYIGVQERFAWTIHPDNEMGNGAYHIVKTAYAMIPQYGIKIK
jgi:hypothetical protein